MGTREFVQASLSIHSCNRCGESCGIPSRPDTQNAGRDVRVAVVLPYFGIPGEKLLRALVREQWKDREVVWIAAKACKAGSADACRSHFETALYALDGLQLLLLVGGEGINAWRPDQQLKKHQGHIGALLGRWFTMPIAHPDSVVKGWESRERYRATLTWARKLDAAGMDPESVAGFKSPYCGVNRCQGTATVWDVDGVGYCEPKHWAKHGGQWKKVRKEWDRMKFEGTQVRLALTTNM